MSSSERERERETVGACNNRGNTTQLTTDCQPHSQLKWVHVSTPPRITVPTLVCVCACVWNVKRVSSPERTALFSSDCAEELKISLFYRGVRVHACHLLQFFYACGRRCLLALHECALTHKGRICDVYE